MTKNQQMKQVAKSKQVSEKRLLRALAPWVKGIAAEYRIGDTEIQQDNADDVRAILRKFYNETSSMILGYDIRQYKQIEDQIEAMQTEVAQQISTVSYGHALSNGAYIAQTASGWVRRITDLAVSQNLTLNEARQALINHLRAHSLTIATTETAWITETTRHVAVMLVNDPLKDSVIQIADLIQAGDTNAAVRLSRRVIKLARQPLSTSQGTLIRVLTEAVGVRGDRIRLMTPLAQGRIVANLTNRANALGKPKKEWSATFHNTRPAHADAEGQQRWAAEPYSVGGELLQYPGDGSLGASLGNLVNCRCASIYV
jgi:hypothetical protein